MDNAEESTMNRRCEVCGSEDTEFLEGNEIFTYKGHDIEVPGYKKLRCHNCGEAVAEPESVKASLPIVRDAQRRIDGLLTGNEIKNIRKSLGYTQEQMGNILGGGEKAFARYETGKVMQSKPMDNLLRILREYPDAIHTLIPKDKEICFTRETNQKPYNPGNDTQ